ncbi:MAG TPA: adenosylcobinamide-phosphate synthase CbiB [Acidimicrobiales bacterium]|jgi:adenosylcobinamide-phosphate synthase|nr:adenosylcobinamide-phosphate synthase CbiB [Acidimicrobiales bacterium]
MSVTSSTARPFGAATGVLLDRLFGEPSTSLHPVVHFGRFMDGFEREHYRDGKSSGVKHALLGVGVGLVTGALIRSTAVATGLAVGGRALHVAAGNVSDALVRGDLDHARELLPTLVGRNASELDEVEIARATVESVAENTVDAVVAPALWAAIAGAPGAFGYRAINTMDAMVGHRSPRYSNYGWASARLDDLANWVPARCTAALVALVRPKAAKDVHWAVTKQAPAHPSPNSGVAEAAFAAALGLRLGGRNHYAERVEDRPTLGKGRAATPTDIAEAVRLSRDVSTALVVILGVTGVTTWVRSL